MVFQRLDYVVCQTHGSHREGVINKGSIMDQQVFYVQRKTKRAERIKSHRDVTALGTFHSGLEQAIEKIDDYRIVASFEVRPCLVRDLL